MSEKVIHVSNYVRIVWWPSVVVIKTQHEKLGLGRKTPRVKRRGLGSSQRSCYSGA